MHKKFNTYMNSTQSRCCLTSQFRRIAHCWMLLVQVSKVILQPGQAYKMGILEKMVNGLTFVLSLI